MVIPERRHFGINYRYGFNGNEKDNEIKGESSQVDYGDRIYDPRLGRWLSKDPFMAKYPGISPYGFSLNNPISFSDKDGDSVIITITIKQVGTTQINLYSSSENKANQELASEKETVPVYEVTVRNDNGCEATFYFTRDAFRGNSKTGEISEVTFDVVNDQDAFSGKIKDRWGIEDYVLELRPLKNNSSQTISALKAGEKMNRTAIQMHVLGASDGCLLDCGINNITELDNLDLDGTSLKNTSKETQKNFMSIIKEYQQDAKVAGKSTFIKIVVEKNSNSKASSVRTHNFNTDKSKFEPKKKKEVPKKESPKSQKLKKA